MKKTRTLNRHLKPSHHAQWGETLIEVLIAMTLVAFSLLGIARLALTATQAQQDGIIRYNANRIFRDLSSRIATNRGQADTTIAVTTVGYALAAKFGASIGSAPTPDCSTASCTASERATYDMYEMQVSTRTLLPAGSLMLTGDSTNGMVLSLMWVDKSFMNTSVSPTVLGTSPTCDSRSTTGQGWITCCPDAAGVVADNGIRCINYYFSP